MGKSWPELPIAAVARPVERLVEPVPGVIYRQIGVRLWGQGAYERESIDGAATKYKTLNRVEAGDIIVNKIWARNGSVAVVPDELAGCHGSGEFPTFAVDPERLLPRWFHWATRTRWFWHRCDLQSRGTSGKNRIRPDKFLAITIPLPPLSEQQRIVAKIDRFAEKIEEARGLREKSSASANRVVSNALSDIFGDRNTSDGILEDYIEDVVYGTSEKTHGEEIGTPVLRMGNIQGGQLDTRDLRYLQIRGKDRPKWILRKSDILVNRTNSAELVGKCAVFDLDGDWAFASYLVRLRLRKEEAEPRLVAYYINSSIGREYMFRERKQMTGQANVNSKKLRALPLRLPPLPEQRRIVAYLDGLQAKVDAIKRLQEQTAAELGALLPSILDRAFRGEL